MPKKITYILFFFLSTCILAQEGRSNELLNEARIIRYTDPEKSVEKSQEALQNAKNYEVKMSAMISLINSYMVLNEVKKVVDHCNEALEMTRKHQDVFNEIRVLSMLGNQYQSLLMNEKARFYLDLAEEKIEKKQLPDSLLFIKGNLYNIKGILFRDDLNCEFALKYFEKSLNVYEKIPGNRLSEVNQMLVEIQKGFCLLNSGDVASANNSFKKVLDYKKSDLGFNRYYALIGRAKVLTIQKDFYESIKLLDSIPTENEESLELSSLLYEAQAENYLQINQLENYLHLIKKFNREKQNLSAEQDKIINQLVIDFDMESKDNLYKSNMKFGTFLLIILLVFGLILWFFIKKLNYDYDS